jgi:hypothetical protein
MQPPSTKFRDWACKKHLWITLSRNCPSWDIKPVSELYGQWLYVGRFIGQPATLEIFEARYAFDANLKVYNYQYVIGCHIFIEFGLSVITVFCVICFTTLSESHIVWRRMLRWLVSSGLGRIRHKGILAQLWYYPGIWMDELKKSTKVFSQDSHCRGRDSNQALPVSTALPLS